MIKTINGYYYFKIKVHFCISAFYKWFKDFHIKILLKYVITLFLLTKLKNYMYKNIFFIKS